MKNFQDKIKRRNFSEMIINRLMNGILAGELKPGDKLPTELEMADLFGVGRNSVREATKILEAMGIVEIFRSDGVYIVKKYNKDILNPRIYGMILDGATEKEILNTLHTFFICNLIRQLKKENITVHDQIGFNMEKLRKEITYEQDIHVLIDLTDHLKLSLVKEKMMNHILKILLDMSLQCRLQMMQQLKSQGKLQIVWDYFENLLQITKTGNEVNLIRILTVDVANYESFTKIFENIC